MEFEIHITVESFDINSFINHCKEINVNAIVIETEKEGVFNNQVMTSSKHVDENYLFVLNDISNKLQEVGYNILRKKVEIRPLFEKNKNHIYYESHLRLKLKRDFDRSILINLCKNSNFHLSKNFFKKDKDFDYQMITYRNDNISFTEFNKVINDMRNRLNDLNVNFDKVEVEECIFDSNIKVDKNWI